MEDIKWILLVIMLAEIAQCRNTQRIRSTLRDSEHPQCKADTICTCDTSKISPEIEVDTVPKNANHS